MKTEIIATELPPELARAFPATRDGGPLHYLVCKHLEQAQRDAILRFCEAVDAEAEANTLKITKAYVDDHFTVFNKLRDEVAKEKV